MIGIREEVVEVKGNKHFINEYNMDKSVIERISETINSPTVECLDFIPGYTAVINDFLTQIEVDSILEDTSNQKWVPVGLDGILSHYTSGDPIGSYRLSCYEPDLANALWNRLAPYLPSERVFNEYSHTDYDGAVKWKPVGINPLFRFIKYLEDGALVPHYDGPFIESDERRSLSTLVMYFTDNKKGGTRFLHDPQSKLPFTKRDFSDWTVTAKTEDITHVIEPTRGKALIFDHRILHDSEPMGHDKTEKMIIRADIMYEKV